MALGVARILAAMLCVATLVACEGEQQKLSEYLERAAAFAADEKHAEAILSYRSVLQIDPNNATAHYGLARSFIATRKPREAYWALHETVRLDPSNREARLIYAQLLLIAQQNEQALEEAGALVDSDPTDPTGHLMRGQALMRLRREAEAREAFEQGMEAAPDAPEPLIFMAGFLARNGDREAAEPLYVRRVEIDRSFDSLSDLARFLAEDPYGDRDADAERLYREALEVAEPDERTVAVQMLASFYYGRDRFADAEQVLQEAIAQESDALPLIYLLARLYASHGETAKADALLEEATRARPDSADAFLLHADYRRRQGNFDGALEAIEAGLRAEPGNLRARLRKAELLVDAGFREEDATRIAQGRSVVDAILAREPENPDALFVRAKIELAESNPPGAVDAMRRALQERPDWARGHFMLGSALFLAGDRSEARAELSKALQFDAALFEARKLLARVHASLGEHDFAIDEARRALKESPDDHELRVLMAQSMMALRDTDDALAAIEQIPEADRGAEAHYALGRIYFSRGDRDAARVHLNAANAAEPNHPEILRAMLNLDLTESRQRETYERIRAAERENPKDARLIHLRGIAALTLGRGGEAETSFRRAIEVDPNHLQSYASLARYLGLRGRRDETLETYRAAIEARPEVAPLRLILGILFEGMGRNEEAIAAYEEAIELDPNLATAKNNLAYLLAESGVDLQRALDLAQDAKSLLPDHPRAADTLGWVLYKKGIPSAAIGYLKEAENGLPAGDPGLGVVRHHLALAYEADGQPEPARRVLERAVSDLDAAGEDGPAEAATEPTWATDVRAMLERLNSGSTAAEG
ncbi:MAG: tetratricopeptide repeat protein [Deltaproteobacteria bacterium]|nr:MAG: tetratricopeptide repeat protein [Deltaproteobacteria bacterium]